MLNSALIEHVRTDHYPSVSMMNTLERLTTGEQRQEFIAALIEKVSQDRFPSNTMIARITRLVT
ncbi:MAG: hypothetical protein M0Z87_06080 [Actinomycetota bacterium]|nr:hypothetical protein [Actinomycetota bacterium]